MKIRQSTRDFHFLVPAQPSGNPTARNLGVIVRSIAEDLHIKPRVELTMAYPTSAFLYEILHQPLSS